MHNIYYNDINKCPKRAEREYTALSERYYNRCFAITQDIYLGIMHMINNDNDIPIVCTY